MLNYKYENTDKIAYNIKICGNNIGNYVIATDEYAIPSVKRAAKELCKYIETTTQIKLPITVAGKNEYEIILGTADGIAKDGYIMKTEGKNLYMLGEGKRGTLYAVYDFLEKYLGWRFYTKDLERCALSDDVIIDGIDERKEPILEYRELDWVCARDKEFAVKLKINGNYRKFGEELGSELNWGGGIHSIGQYLKCNSHTEQPCLSDPENIKSVIEQVGKILEENPDLDIFEISQNDNQNFCTCDRCKAIDEEEGNHAGTVIRFINALSDAFKDKYPKLHFQTFAYQYTRKPPKKTKPNDNVIIKLCPMECCYSHPFDDPDCKTNNEFKEDLEGWNKICRKVYIWDYSSNYAYFCAPFPNFEVMRKNIKFLVDNSVKGYYPEANYIAESGEFGELRSYLHSKLMWNPYMDKEEYYAHMDDFLRAYYGVGREGVRKFIDFTMEESSKHHCDLWSEPFVIIPREVYEEKLDEINSWWDEAEGSAWRAGDKISCAHVCKSRLQWTFIKLTCEYEKRYLNGDNESRKQYRFDNIKFFADLCKNNIVWREAFMYPPLTDFTKPPLEWSKPHTYGQPEEPIEW